MIHLVDEKKEKIVQASLEDGEDGVSLRKTSKQPRPELDQKRLENLSDQEKIKLFNQWSAKTSFVHPEEPYEASLRGLATARLHCRYEMSKILDEVSKINPRILKENIHKTQF